MNDYPFDKIAEMTQKELYLWSKLDPSTKMICIKFAELNYKPYKTTKDIEEKKAIIEGAKYWNHYSLDKIPLFILEKFKKTDPI